MKSLMILFFLMPSAIMLDGNLADITAALNQGNTDVLGKYFDADIELSIMDEDDVLGKAAALTAMKKFFAKYPAAAFSQVHQGRSKGKDSQYCIGNLTAGGKTFRLYIYMQNVGGNEMIKELRVDLP